MLKKLSLAFLCIAFYAVFGQDHSKGLLDLQQLKLDSYDATLVAYPDANDVMLDDRIVITYKPDGTSVSWDDTAVKVLTEQGRRDNRTISLHFDQAYSKNEFILIQTIAEDGTITNHDVSKISAIMTNNSQMNSNIYNPNDKILKANIPGVEINTIIRYLIRRETFKPRVPNTFSDYELFEYTSPIIRFSQEIHAPKELPLNNIALLSPVEGTVSYEKSEHDDEVIHSWVARNVPQAFPEPKMPALHKCVQRLLVSTIKDWKDVSRWYWNLCLPHLKTTPEIDEKVSELCKGQADDTAKIRSIFRFVSQEIRYMGETVETEAPGYEPHDIAQTFGKRHGVCRDKAALLAAMLRSAGFEAFPVLISVGPLMDTEVPLPYFNHAITAIRTGEKFMLMDSTDENTAELFPAYLGNKSYLVATPEGTSLMTSDVPDENENMMKISTHCDIDDKGNMTGYASFNFLGINDNAYRGAFATRTQDETRLFIQSLLKRTIAGAQITRLKLQPENMMDTETPLSMEISFKAPSVMAGDSNTAFFNYPLFSASVGLVNFIIGDASLDKRRFPYVCKYKCGVEEAMTINFASTWGTPNSMPEYPEIKNDTMEWSRSLSFNSGLLSLNSRLAIKTVQFSAQEYDSLKDTLRKIEANDKKMPIFDRNINPLKSPISPDTYILDDVTSTTLTSATEWKSVHYQKFQILTYNGMKENSEIVLGFIPDYETVTVDYAKVYNGADCKELNVSENKIMDGSWNASAPRYPKGKTLIANLPGVAVGSIVELQYTTTSKGVASFSTVSTFRDFSPVKHKELNISFPKSLKLDTIVSQNGVFMDGNSGDNNISFSQKEDGDTIKYSWSSANQPPVKHETNLPRLRFVFPSLMVSTDKWTNYAKKLNAAFEEHSIVTEKLQKIADDLAVDKLRKVEIIRDMVAKQVRTAGPAFHTVGLENLSNAETTLNDAYGNDADKAILIYTLLKAAGFSPEFVFFNSSLMSMESVNALIKSPSPTIFTKVLVRVKVSGVNCWINTGDQYSKLGTCDYDGHAAINSSGKIYILSLDKEYKSSIETKKDVYLLSEGGARIVVEKRYFGSSFNSMNKTLREHTPEERRRFHLKLLDDISTSASKDGELTDDFTQYPGIIRFAANVPDYAIKQNSFLYTDLEVPGQININADTRTLPYEYAKSMDFTLVTNIHLPDEVQNTVFVPAPRKYILSDKKAFCEFSISKGKDISAKFVCKYSPFLLKNDEYKVFIEELRLLAHPAAEKIILELNKKQ